MPPSRISTRRPDPVERHETRIQCVAVKPRIQRVRQASGSRPDAVESAGVSHFQAVEHPHDVRPQDLGRVLVAR